MNLDLLYIISFVLLRGNIFSNTDILKLNIKSQLIQKDNFVVFYMLELCLFITEYASLPEKLRTPASLHKALTLRLVTSLKGF